MRKVNHPGYILWTHKQEGLQSLKVSDGGTICVLKTSR